MEEITKNKKGFTLREVHLKEVYDPNGNLIYSGTLTDLGKSLGYQLCGDNWGNEAILYPNGDIAITVN